MALENPQAIALKTLLEKMTRPAELCETLPDGRVLCYACGHECKIAEGKAGVCRVRFNRGGVLMAPHGYVGALACDPIEKKPFFHAFPGRDALSFGMLGCDLHCGYCQNWVTSQALRDDRAVSQAAVATARQLVDAAIARHAPVVASTYNEPLITSEWAVDVLKLARDKGLVGAYISNGNATQRVLEYIQPYVQLYKVDLKSFQDRRYRDLGGQLPNVLRTIRQLHAMGFWVEIVTLIVPGFNDSAAELGEMAAFVAEVSPDMPWHVTAFHSDYRMDDTASTPVDKLLEACEIGTAAGLRYVYAGNRPGMTGEWENTRCPNCRATVIERWGFTIRSNRLESGHCPDCRTAIAGYWDRQTVIPQERMGHATA
jgi:pyruvate formate lyase activating enzyme